MTALRRWTLGVALATLGGIYSLGSPFASQAADAPHDEKKNLNTTSLEWMLPNDGLKRPFAEQTPITFVSRGTNPKVWDKLTKYWNVVEVDAVDPASGKKVKQQNVLVKLPLGINVLPTVPVENPMTLARWELGKKLYFDKALSSNNKVSCATCHDPAKGYTDNGKTSLGINDQLGGMNSPTVVNSAFNRFQFWDGRGSSLEDQAQGPVGNAVEMFDGKGTAWHEAVKRVRVIPGYAKLFEAEFGHPATRDAIAKAIASYERTVIVGNSIHDRTEFAARKRAEEEESNKTEPTPKDYQKVIQEAIAANDTHNLKALGLDTKADAQKVTALAASIDNGRKLFFNKARCNSCHVGESFTDHSFHNLGVGVVEGKLPLGQEGRFGSQPTGAKDPAMFGAFKTPPLRGLLASKPYMHDGGEKTLEDVVDFYDRGGNANAYLDPKMRDYDAEQAYIKAKAAGTKWTGTPVTIFTQDGKPVIPLKLNLTPEEKKDLVNFMRALESDPVDSHVSQLPK